MEENMVGTAVDSMSNPEQVSPEMQGKINTYITAGMKIVHDDQTNPEIVNMLKAAPAEQSIPHTANQVEGMINTSVQKRGDTVDPSVRLAGMMYLTMDLMELGNVSGAFEKPVGEADLQPILTETLKQAVHTGLKNGDIDPVELQAQTEPLLNDQQKQLGMQAASKIGLPPSPTMQMGIDTHAQNKMRPLEEENKKLKGMLQQGGAPQ